MNRTDINAQRIKELSAGLQPCSAVPRLSSTIPACCPPGSVISSWNRSMEPLRLEKTSEFPNPPHCAHCLRPSVPHPRGSGAPPGMGTPPHSLGSCAVQHRSLGEEIFPNIQPEPPRRTSKPSPLVPSVSLQDIALTEMPTWEGCCSAPHEGVGVSTASKTHHGHSLDARAPGLYLPHMPIPTHKEIPVCAIFLQEAHACNPPCAPNPKATRIWSPRHSNLPLFIPHHKSMRPREHGHRGTSGTHLSPFVEQ